MYSPFQLGIKYISYYLRSSNGKGHGMHSPFVFHFITKVLNNKEIFSGYKKIEKVRKKLLADRSMLSIEDYGAGSAVSKKKERTVASITKNAAKAKKYGQLLYRIVKEYQPETIVELGTSVGITTSYLSLANPLAKIFTLEGAPSVAAIAKNNFQKLDLKNITVVEGDFGRTLSSVFNQLRKIDFIFVDGNHRRVPTQQYFQKALQRTHNDSILIFDDIHWSKEMEEAWQNIKDHPSVRCSIDLFFIGIVLFRKEFLEKQHFSIRF